jgi:hypothetical protein
MARHYGAMMAAMSGNADEIRCSNCRHLLSPEHVGPCPACGGTAKTIYAEKLVQFHAIGHLEATVIPFAQLPEALKENRDPILLKLPQFLPAFIVVFVLTQIANSDGLLRSLVLSFTGLAFLALLQGYNVEYSSTVSASGKLISALKLKKKNRQPQQETEHDEGGGTS